MPVVPGLCSKSQHDSQLAAFKALNLNDKGQVTNTDIKKDTQKREDSDHMADKLDALRSSGLEVHTRDDIEQMMANLDGDLREPDPVREDGGEEEDWEYGVPPPPTDRVAERDEL